MYQHPSRVCHQPLLCGTFHCAHGAVQPGTSTPTNPSKQVTAARNIPRDSHSHERMRRNRLALGHRLLDRAVNCQVASLLGCQVGGGDHRSYSSAKSVFERSRSSGCARDGRESWPACIPIENPDRIAPGNGYLLFVKQMTPFDHVHRLLFVLAPVPKNLPCCASADAGLGLGLRTGAGNRRDLGRREGEEAMDAVRLHAFAQPCTRGGRADACMPLLPHPARAAERTSNDGEADITHFRWHHCGPGWQRALHPSRVPS